MERFSNKEVQRQSAPDDLELKGLIDKIHDTEIFASGFQVRKLWLNQIEGYDISKQTA